MQPQSAQRTPVSRPRFDSKTGRRRRFWYSWRALAGGAVLALLAGSGIAVASVAASQANVPSITFDCTGIQVDAKWYTPSPDNTVTVTIDGVVQGPFVFGKEFHQFFPFADSTKAWQFTAAVVGGGGQASLTKTGPSTPCAPPTIVSLTAPRCDTVNGTTDLTASFQTLIAGRPYTLALTSTGPGGQTVTFTPTQASESYTWPGLAPGYTYTVTITDTTNPHLKASTSVATVGCPQQSGITIDPTQCTVPGGTATFLVTATDLIAGREYRIDIVNAASHVVEDTYTFTATSSHGQRSYAGTPSSSYYATVTDTKVTHLSITSSTYIFLPCPVALTGPTLSVSQCNTVSSSPSGSISLTANGLVPGRSYNIVVTDGTTVVLNVLGHVATSSTYRSDLTGLPAGTYTATVTDALVPGFTSSQSALLVACPTAETTIDLSATQCTVPGGTGSISATIANFAIGRPYTVKLAQGGTVLDTKHFTATSNAAQVFSYSGLAPNLSYRVTVTDDNAVPAVNAAQDIVLLACPGNPVLVATQAQCLILGTSSVKVELDKLVSGETYTVSIVVASTNKPVTGVPAQTVAGTVPKASLVFPNVPNGATYTVSIANVAKTLTASSRVVLATCDLPTFPLPPELPTLALTGASTLAPALTGVGFLQLGIMFVGFGLIGRRRRGSEA